MIYLAVSYLAVICAVLAMHFPGTPTTRRSGVIIALCLWAMMGVAAYELSLEAARKTVVIENR